jgi:hypothetical protein
MTPLVNADFLTTLRHTVYSAGEQGPGTRNLEPVTWNP